MKYIVKKDFHKNFKDPIIDLVEFLEKKFGTTQYLQWVRAERVKEHMVTPMPQHILE